jgi:hypothetical protein
MSGLRRPTPAKRLVELTKRLAEDYDSVPLPEVSRIVHDAAATATGGDGDWTGTPAGVPAIVEVIEHVAREDLDEMHADPANGTTTTRGSTGLGPREVRRNGRRRGAGSRG